MSPMARSGKAGMTLQQTTRPITSPLSHHLIVTSLAPLSSSHPLANTSLGRLSLATPLSPCASVVHASPDLTCVLCAVAGRCSRRGRRPVGYMYTPMVPCMAACLSWWLQCLAIRHAARCACSRLPAVAYVLASFSWHVKQVLYM